MSVMDPRSQEVVSHDKKTKTVCPDEDKLRQPLIHGHTRFKPQSTRQLAHLFFHPDSPRTQRQGKLFCWLASLFRSFILGLVCTNLLLTLIDALPIHLDINLQILLYDINTGIIIPLSLIFFTIEYLGRFWSIPETDPLSKSWQVRLFWAVHLLPMLELFAVVMMWFSVGQMVIGHGTGSTANTAALARAARLGRIISKIGKVGKTAAKANKLGKAARATKAMRGAAAAANTAYVVTEAGREVTESKQQSGGARQAVINKLRGHISPGLRHILENADALDMVPEDHDHSDAECAHLHHEDEDEEHGGQ